METIFINMKNSKMNEPHKFVPNLSQILDLRSSKNHLALQNLSIYYSWENIRKQYENNELKIITQTWNNDFGLPDGSYSVSDIQDYIKYMIKKHETLTTGPPIHVYIDRIIDLCLKYGYTLELQTHETMKLFGRKNNQSINQSINK